MKMNHPYALFFVSSCLIGVNILKENNRFL